MIWPIGAEKTLLHVLQENTQRTFNCLKSTMETPEQCAKSVQS